VPTCALRVQFGIEPRLTGALFGHGLLGRGADIARISARESSANDGSLLLAPHAQGTQARAMGEFSLGLLRHGEVVDVGLVAQAIFAFQEVQYSAKANGGETLLVKPWPIQPALSLQGRFRSGL